MSLSATAAAFDIYVVNAQNIQIWKTKTVANCAAYPDSTEAWLYFVENVVARTNKLQSFIIIKSGLCHSCKGDLNGQNKFYIGHLGVSHQGKFQIWNKDSKQGPGCKNVLVSDGESNTQECYELWNRAQTAKSCTANTSSSVCNK